MKIVETKRQRKQRLAKKKRKQRAFNARYSYQGDDAKPLQSYAMACPVVTDDVKMARLRAFYRAKYGV